MRDEDIEKQHKFANEFRAIREKLYRFVKNYNEEPGTHMDEDKVNHILIEMDRLGGDMNKKFVVRYPDEDLPMWEDLFAPLFG